MLHTLGLKYCHRSMQCQPCVLYHDRLPVIHWMTHRLPGQAHSGNKVALLTYHKVGKYAFKLFVSVNTNGLTERQKKAQ